MLPIASILTFVLPELIIMLALTVFWIWMLIDCATKETQQRDKNTWLLVIVLVPLGGLIYLFARKLGQTKRALPGTA